MHLTYSNAGRVCILFGNKNTHLIKQGDQILYSHLASPVFFYLKMAAENIVYSVDGVTVDY